MALLKKLFKQEKVKIDFCQNNLDKFLSEQCFSDFNSFLSQKNIDFKEYTCQSKCEICEESPYAIINGEVEKAETAEQLLKKLKERVNR
ncbi:DUF1450 domain-containing protein [Evansella cellulosilytica]|nr:DUF1450 domain-containing protein [Evansella cellulosilytica]